MAGQTLLHTSPIAALRELVSFLQTCTLTQIGRQRLLLAQEVFKLCIHILTPVAILTALFFALLVNPLLGFRIFSRLGAGCGLGG